MNTSPWCKLPYWWWYSFLSSLLDYRPKWYGRHTHEGWNYSVYTNEETGKDYLVTKRRGLIWYRNHKMKPREEEEN